MEPLQAVVLGAIQGLTEFFPVSSSGHLVIFQQLMGLKEPVLLFDISVHVGTLAAIFCYYFKDILRLAAAFFQVLPWGEPKRGRPVSPETLAESRMAWLIVAGSVPTALIGGMLNTISDVLFSSLALVGLALVVTGAIVLATRWAPPGSRGRVGGFPEKSVMDRNGTGAGCDPGNFPVRVHHCRVSVSWY